MRKEKNVKVLLGGSKKVLLSVIMLRVVMLNIMALLKLPLTLLDRLTNERRKHKH